MAIYIFRRKLAFWVIFQAYSSSLGTQTQPTHASFTYQRSSMSEHIVSALVSVVSLVWHYISKKAI